MNNNDDKKQRVINQMAWIVNYQPTIGEQHIHMGSQETVDEPRGEEAEFEVVGDAAEEHTQPSEGEKQKSTLNYFAPAKNLKELLKESWFAEVRTSEKYNAAWTDGFIDALMASEWRDEIARDWSVSGVRNKRGQIKGHVVGLLKDAGVLKGSYDSIARKVGATDDARLFARYMSDGKRQPYADWVKEYASEG